MNSNTPQPDETHISDEEIEVYTAEAVQPESVWERIGHYNKVIAAALVNLVALIVLLATGEEVDPEILASAQGVVVTLLVWFVRNR